MDRRVFNLFFDKSVDSKGGREAIKYEGYIKRQLADIENFKALENTEFPDNIDFTQIDTITLEAREKLQKIKPTSLGQASRISGISHADITSILVYLKKNQLKIRREI